MRARLRIATAVAWLVLASVGAVASTFDEDVTPLFRRRDCAVQITAELEPLREALPPRAVVGFMGERAYDGCDPMMVAQYVFAPAWVMEQDWDDLRAAMRARGDQALPRDPALVLVWGEEGRAWLAAHPRYVPIAPPTEHATLVAREP